MENQKEHKELDLSKVITGVSISIIVLLVAAGLYFYYLSPTTASWLCHHQYPERTCASDQICPRCGTVVGPGLEHQYEDATCTQAKHCVVCGLEVGTKIDHKWMEANCSRPETCFICKETRGEIGDHRWIEATCTEPRKCDICGDTEGEALGHSMTQATCEYAAKCTRCGITDGEPAGHKFVDCICSNCGVQRVTQADVKNIITFNQYARKKYSSTSSLVAIKFTNKSKKRTIKSVEFTLTAYDKDGNQLGEGRCMYEYKVKPKKTSKSNWGWLVLVSDSSKVKSTKISNVYIEYTDGSTIDLSSFTIK